MKMKKLLLACVLFTATSSHALDGWYVGGQVGHLGLTGDASRAFNNTIGFGLDVGLRANPSLDLNLAIQLSSHSGGAGLTLISQALSADLRLYDNNDFELFAGAGPGFYFFKSSGLTDSKFGLNGGVMANVRVDDNIRVGLGWKYHAIFDKAGSNGNYYTIMMRFGYYFDLGGV